MTKVASVWRKEFRAFWYSYMAYIVITVFIVIVNWFYFSSLYIAGDANVAGLFGFMPVAFMFLMPALTMRQWAEERKTGTIEMLMTLPVREWEVVLGKYLSAASFLAVILLLMLPTMITVAALSQNGLDWGMVLTSYLGTFCFGLAVLAIGGWVSSFSENQMVAFVLGLALSFVAIMLGSPMVTYRTPGLLAPLVEYLGLGTHFSAVSRGVIDTRDLVYFASVIFLFLYLTVRSVESRKWS
jgi:ABC-2 type transport system permease protein